MKSRPRVEHSRAPSSLARDIAAATGSLRFSRAQAATRGAAQAPAPASRPTQFASIARSSAPGRPSSTGPQYWSGWHWANISSTTTAAAQRSLVAGVISDPAGGAAWPLASRRRLSDRGFGGPLRLASKMRRCSGDM